MQYKILPLSGLVGKVKEWDADGGKCQESTALDTLMQLLHMCYDIGQFSEYGESIPEIVVTLPASAFSRLSEAALHGQFKATHSGEHAISGLPWLKYDYSQAYSSGPCFSLVIQQGVETAPTEIRN